MPRVCKTVLAPDERPGDVNRELRLRAEEWVTAEGLPVGPSIIGHHCHSRVSADGKVTDWTTTILLSDGSYRSYRTIPVQWTDGPCVGYSMIVGGNDGILHGVSLDDFVAGEDPHWVSDNVPTFDALCLWREAQRTAREEGKSV